VFAHHGNRESDRQVIFRLVWGMANEPISMTMCPLGIQPRAEANRLATARERATPRDQARPTLSEVGKTEWEIRWTDKLRLRPLAVGPMVPADRHYLPLGLQERAVHRMSSR